MTGRDAKERARQQVWDRLSEERIARFPFPPHGRIPNFKGAEQAAALLFEAPPWCDAKRLKVNPDAPQRPVRLEALRRGIAPFVPTPRLRAGFVEFDPTRIPADRLRQAASLSRGRRFGREVTTVHPFQIVERLPRDPTDLPVALIVTPEERLPVGRPPPPPTGIDWDHLSDEALEEMPVLAELRGLNSPGHREPESTSCDLSAAERTGQPVPAPPRNALATSTGQRNLGPARGDSSGPNIEAIANRFPRSMNPPTHQH